jgi:hypothetical protein
MRHSLKRLKAGAAHRLVATKIFAISPAGMPYEAIVLGAAVR